MPRTARVPLEVVMVPLERKRTINPPNFPRFPRLYLELLQNRDKIKSEFLKEEFVPKYNGPEIVFDNDGDDMTHSHREPSLPKGHKPVKASAPRVPTTGKAATPSKKPASKMPPMKSSAPTTKTVKTDDAKGAAPSGDKKADVIPDDLFGDSPPTQSAGTESDPLAAFLKKSRSIGSRQRPDGPERRHSYENHKGEILRDEKKVPPSLAELADGGAFEMKGGIKDMGRVSKREQDEEQKLRQYLYKFDLLRMSHNGADIPKFTINSDPEYVAKTYDDILRNLSMTDNITKYKKYLMFGFMGVEALGGNVLGFDMKGFTKQQQVEMSSYDKLLIELGEKNYTPKSNWPVELRLLGMIIMNAAFFVASKMALKATGTDVLTSMNAAANAGVATSNIQQRKKQRMSGPDINLDDIPSSGPKEPAPPVNSGGVTFVTK